MDEKIKNAMKFYLLATKLKYKIRSGWDNKHWNVTSERIESIAEHVYGTCILAIAIESEFKYDIDLNKVMYMLVLHEIGEVLIGDITPFEAISKEQKMQLEHDAMGMVLGDLCKKEEYLNLLFEFDACETKEAMFAYLVDKMEADIQSKLYQDMGCHNPLNQQENNVVFKSDKVLKMVENGAETVFDIWYLWDKEIYEHDTTFKKILNYIKDNNINI